MSPALYQDFMDGYINPKTLPISGYYCGYELKIESYG